MDPVDEVLGWHRLDRRMLLVHPVREVVRFLPVLIGLLLFRRGSDGGGLWGLIGVAIPVGARPAALRHDELPAHVGPGRGAQRPAQQAGRLDTRWTGSAPST